MSSLSRYFGKLETVRFDRRTNVPATLTGELQRGLALSDDHAVRKFFERSAPVFRFNSAQDDFVTESLQSDETGMTHLRLQQTYKHVPVFGAELILHADREQTLREVSGRFIPDLATDVQPQITAERSIAVAREEIGPARFRWERDASEVGLQRLYGARLKSWKPKPELVISPVHGDYRTGDFKLAWHFIMAIDSPFVANMHYFVDAHNGVIINSYNTIYHADTTNTGLSNYYGTLQFRANSFAKGYEMLDSARGIATFDLNYQNPNWRVTIPPAPVSNATSSWTDSSERVMVDAHWEVSQVYDYYLNVHGRKSYDGNGAPLIVGIHLGTHYVNAFWDGSEMCFGDGDGSLAGPMTVIDVCGHELTHAVTSSTAKLIYQNESGALNEAMSDGFGTFIEYYVCTHASINKTPNWWMGEDCWTPKTPNDALRYLDNPKRAHQPNTYQGQYWQSTTLTAPGPNNDYNGVHQNSTVMGYIFYLMSEGGSGTNDKGYNYSVTGMSVQKLEKVSYAALTKYLTSSADYLACRQAFLSAATALYGVGSPEYHTVLKAFDAANVGGPRVTLTAPMGNEQWYAGDAHAITWTIDEVDSVTISYSTDNAATWNILVPSMPAIGGSYLWNIPPSLTTQSPLRCIVRVSSIADPGAHDSSHAVFTIIPKIPWLSVLSPSEGESWKSGTSQTISWIGQFVSNATVEFIHGGTTDTIAANYQTSQGTMTWTVPSAEFPSCRIRLSDPSNPSVVALSDSFAILRHPTIVDTFFYGNSRALFSASGNGYIVGTNGYGDIGKYQRFDNTSAIVLQSCLLHFGAKQIVGSSDTVRLVVRGVNGDGSPGATLATYPFLTDTIDTLRHRNILPIAPLNVQGPFFLGIEWSKTTDDLFGLFSDASREGNKAHRAWEQWKDGSYHRMDDSWNGIDIDLWMRALYTSIAPELALPANGSADSSTTATLQWNPLTGSSPFRVQLSTDSLFSAGNVVVDDSTLTDSTRQVANLQRGTKYFWRVGVRDRSGWMAWSHVWRFVISIKTDVASTGSIPSAFGLAQNFPNPFNPTTVISYQSPVSSHISLKIYDILGREVATLVDAEKPAGVYQVSFDASKLASGIYIYRLEAGTYVRSRKMLLTK